MLGWLNREEEVRSGANPRREPVQTQVQWQIRDKVPLKYSWEHQVISSQVVYATPLVHVNWKLGGMTDNIKMKVKKQ